MTYDLADAVYAARLRRRPADLIARTLAAGLNGDQDQGAPEPEAPIALNSPKLRDRVLAALNTPPKEQNNG